MRIAQVAPMFEAVPPKFYGGTERVVSYLTEELVAQGHDVTLFASGDSRTNAQLVSPVAQALRLTDSTDQQVIYHVLALEEVLRRAPGFDVIHFHWDCLHYPSIRRLDTPSLTTLHGRLDLPDLVPLYREYANTPVVSISNAQRAPLPWLNWAATVYHGLPPDLLHLHPEPGSYLAFLGRLSPEKRVDRAVDMARRTGVTLKIAAKADPADREYFESVVRPLLDDPIVEFIGEIGEADKDAFLGEALALAFPIDWPEPFGLVMIEAMACGTPVIAYDCGSTPEVVDAGATGFIVRSQDDAVAAVAACRDFDRRRCRAVFERRFTTGRMARDYVAVCQALCAEQRRPRAWRAATRAEPIAAASSGLGLASAPPPAARTGERLQDL